MALVGFHYLAYVFDSITDEDDKMAVENRQNRLKNVYFGTLPAPYTGLKFSFAWRIEKGEVNVASETASASYVAWRFSFFGVQIDQGRHRLNTNAGRALLKQISKAEAKLAVAQNDQPGAGDKAKAQQFKTDIAADEAAGNIVPTPDQTLQDLYTTLGI